MRSEPTWDRRLATCISISRISKYIKNVGASVFIVREGICKYEKGEYWKERKKPVLFT